MKKLSRFQAIAIAIVMAAAVAAPIVIAQTANDGNRAGRHGHFGRHGGRGDFGMMGFRNLDLTDAQKAQLKQIRENHSQSIAPLMQEIRAKRQEIRQGGAFDESQVAQKLKEIAPLEAKLMGERARIHQEMLSVLTPDQKAKLDQMREQFKSKRSERRAGKGQKSV
jgi:periplasmic protein CpxP/Spy